MFSSTRNVLASLLVSLSLVRPLFAASCFNTPKWAYDSNTFNDVWDARANLCTQNGSGVQCSNDFGSSIVCRVNVGHAYAVMEGKSGNLNGMYQYCMDAFNDINNQCIYKNQPGGNYHYGGNSYWLEVVTIPAVQ